MRQFRPQDATTNPSLLLKAAQQPQYRGRWSRRRWPMPIAWAWPQAPSATEAFMDRLAVNFGREILKIVPGRSRPKSMRA